MACILFSISASAAIVITSSNQLGSGSFIPTWPIETNSLIAGEFPSGPGSGNFSYEAGVAGVVALTDGTFGDVNDRVSYATCGSIASQSVTYYLRIPDYDSPSALAIARRNRSLASLINRNKGLASCLNSGVRRAEQSIHLECRPHAYVCAMHLAPRL